MTTKTGNTSLTKQTVTDGGGTDSKTPMSKQARPAKKFNPEMFNAGIMAIVKSSFEFSDDHDYDNAAYQLISEFNDSLDMPIADTYPNALEAVHAVEEWVDKCSWYYQPPILFDIKSLTVTITAQAPSGQISVSMNAEPRPDTELDIVIASMKLQLQQAFVSAFPKSAQSPKAAQKQEKKSGDAIEETSGVDCIRRQMYQGKMVTRVIPDSGRWKRHGIPLYDGTAKKHEIDLPDEEGDYSFEGTVTFEETDDKPTRVTFIEGEFTE